MSRVSMSPLIYIGLGDKDQAFAWLDKAYQEHCDYLVYLPTDPMADPLRNDPRFRRVAGTPGFEEIRIAKNPAVSDRINAICSEGT